jgi:hypothetical protein
MIAFWCSVVGLPVRAITHYYDDYDYHNIWDTLEASPSPLNVGDYYGDYDYQTPDYDDRANTFKYIPEHLFPSPLASPSPDVPLVWLERGHWESVPPFDAYSRDAWQWVTFNTSFSDLTELTDLANYLFALLFPFSPSYTLYLSHMTPSAEPSPSPSPEDDLPNLTPLPASTETRYAVAELPTP